MRIMFIICTIFVVVGCEKEKIYLTDYFNQTIKCTLNELSEYPCDSIGHADFIFSQDDYILLSEPKLDYLISSYNIKTKEFTRFLSKGNGPNTLLDVQQVGLYKEDSLFFVKSTFGKKIFIYSFTDKSVHKEIPVNKNDVSLFFDAEQMICSQYGKKRFSIYDTNNQSRIEFGDSITIGDSSQELVSHILQGLCVANKNLKRFLWTSMYGDVFEIYDYKDISKIQTVVNVKGILPIITVSNNQPVFSIDSKLGIVSLTATNKYIYMLYNEHLIKDFANQKEDILLCNKILVYDWNGIPQKILNIDKEIRSISYNNKYKMLHCIGYDADGNGKIFYIDVSE